MKSKKSLNILTTVLILAVAAFGLYYSYSHSAGDWREEDGNDDTIATVNGEKIPRERFENYKKTLNRNQQYSDEEILNKMIERIVLYDEAKAEGFKASDEEINDEIAKAKDGLSEDKRQTDFLKNYFVEMGITEEEYWGEIVPDEYRRTIPINKLYKSKREEFCNDVTDNDVLEKGFGAYWDSFINDLISKADIRK